MRSVVTGYGHIHSGSYPALELTPFRGQLGTGVRVSASFQIGGIIIFFIIIIFICHKIIIQNEKKENIFCRAG